MPSSCACTIWRASIAVAMASTSAAVPVEDERQGVCHCAQIAALAFFRGGITINASLVLSDSRGVAHYCKPLVEPSGGQDVASVAVYVRIGSDVHYLVFCEKYVSHFGGQDGDMVDAEAVLPLRLEPSQASSDILVWQNGREQANGQVCCQS